MLYKQVNEFSKTTDIISGVAILDLYMQCQNVYKARITIKIAT